MVQVDAIRARIIGDSRSLEDSLRRADLKLRRFNQSANRSLAGFQRGVNRAARQTRVAMWRMRRSISNTTRQIRKDMAGAELSWGRFAAATASIALVGTAFAQFSDTATNVRNRIRLVTGEGEELEKMYAKLRDTAIETRTAFEATARTFSRVAIAGRAVGVSIEEAQQITETLNKALIVSGATVQEQWSALLQFSQAFASGRLQGEELRALRESAPLVVEAFARELGGTLENIRDFAEQGKITRDVMRRALIGMAADVDEQFGKVDITIAQSITNLKTSITDYVGGVNEATKVSVAFAEAIQSIADNIPAVTTGLGVMAAFLGGAAIKRALRFAIGNPALITAALTAIAAGTLVGAAAQRSARQENAASQTQELADSRESLERALDSGNQQLIAEAKARFNEAFIALDRNEDIIRNGPFATSDVGAAAPAARGEIARSRRLRSTLGLPGADEQTQIDRQLLHLGATSVGDGRDSDAIRLAAVGEREEQEARARRNTQAGRRAEEEGRYSSLGYMPDLSEPSASLNNLDGSAFRDFEEEIGFRTRLLELGESEAEVEEKLQQLKKSGIVVGEEQEKRARALLEAEVEAEEAKKLRHEEEQKRREETLEREQEFEEARAAIGIPPEDELEMLRMQHAEIERLEADSYERRLAMERIFEENRLKEEVASGKARLAFEAMSGKDKAKTIFGDLANITRGVAQHNKGLFRLNQLAGIANATINAYEGASRTLKEYPWPLGGVLAGIHLAAGFAQVRAIAGASFGGGARSGSIPSGGSGRRVAPSDIGNADAQNRVIHVRLDELNPNASYRGQTIIDLFEELNEASGDGLRFQVGS